MCLETWTLHWQGKGHLSDQRNRLTQQLFYNFHLSVAIITEHSGNSFVSNYALVPELGLQNKKRQWQTCVPQRVLEPLMPEGGRKERWGGLDTKRIGKLQLKNMGVLPVSLMSRFLIFCWDSNVDPFCYPIEEENYYSLRCTFVHHPQLSQAASSTVDMSRVGHYKCSDDLWRISITATGERD